MTIAADTCIYTNHNFTVETIDSSQSVSAPVDGALINTTAAPAAANVAAPSATNA